MTSDNKTPQSSSLIQNLALLAVIAASAFFFWDTVRSMLIFVLTLGFLVAIHEWGHFIACRLTGVHVFEFAIGFGPRLWTYMRKKGTDYTVRAFMVGGFVLPKGAQPDEHVTRDGLNGRRPAERALVYLGGPLVNAVFGIVLLMFLGFLVGTPDPGVVLVAQVERKSPAARMEVVAAPPGRTPPPGLRVGDRILEVDGFPVDAITTPGRIIHGKANQPIVMVVQRGDQKIHFRGTPSQREIKSEFLTVVSTPAETRLPLLPGDQIDDIDGLDLNDAGPDPAATVERRLAELKGKRVRLTVWRTDRRLVVEGESGPVELAVRAGSRNVGRLGFGPIEGQGPRVDLPTSFRRGWVMLSNFGLQMTRLFSSPKRLGENLGGPVAIWATLSEAHRLPPMVFLNMLILLSLSLAIFNLVPIPGLDGGHLTVLGVEVLRGRRLEPRQHMWVQGFGISLLLVLFVYIFVKDLIKHVL